jgi:hypothetical protein
MSFDTSLASAERRCRMRIADGAGRGRRIITNGE